jgi:hypothetical protein
MNHSSKPDNNAMFDSELPETRQHLDALEQRLRATRPQPPRLDVAALMPTADEQLVEHRTTVAGRLWIAGSWAGGAAIGALVMFVLMSGTTSEAEQDRAVDSRLAPKVADRDDPGAPQSISPRFANEEASETARAISMLTFDLLDEGRSGYFSDGETLQVGMYLMQRTGNARAPRMHGGFRDVEGKRLESDPISRPHSSPLRPITRQKVIQELLDDPAGAIL